MADCHGRPPVALPQATDPEAEARAAAHAFVGCLERHGAECRPEAAPFRCLGALDVLRFIRDASPLAVLAGLAGRVAEAGDDVALRKRLVRELWRWEASTRDAGCRALPAGVLSPDELSALGRDATARAERLGLAAAGSADTLGRLTHDLEPLASARVFRLSCERGNAAPYLLFIPAEGVFRLAGASEAPFRVGRTEAAFAPLTLAAPPDSVLPALPVSEEAL